MDAPFKTVGVQVRNMKMVFNISALGTGNVWKTNDENLWFFYSAKSFSHPV